MRNGSLTEKEKIEWATAKAFIEHYNKIMKASFQIIKHLSPPDPDFLCLDSQKNELKLEVTLTEDHPGDIHALLGRSNHKTLEALKKHNKLVEAGVAHPFEWSSSYENVTQMLCKTIEKKINKEYGINTALVVRDTSPIGWDWSMGIDFVKTSLDLSRNPFDKGIWIISYDKDEIFFVC